MRRKTSHSQAQVQLEASRAMEAMRPQSDKDRLDRILSERRLGDYDILDELGRGGMGVVFKAFHRNLKRMVALKVVLTDASEGSEVMVKRFKREAELHARLSHPNIVNVYDSGVVDGIHYFAMNFVTGTQLTKLIGSPEFSLRQRVNVMRQVAEALHHAHGHGVVHRDIKPDNIIVDAGWKANLVDFGIAKPTDMSGQENITRQGLAVGTPHYMAPEQFRPNLGGVGAHTDVYAMGAVFYHTLCGRAPFEADSAHAVLIKAATQTAASIDGADCPSEEKVSADMAAIVAKCMHQHPDERYQTAQLVAQDIRRFLKGREVSANPLTDKQRLYRTLSKNRQTLTLFSSMSAVLMVLIGAVVYTINSSKRALASIQESVELAASKLNEAVDVASMPTTKSIVDDAAKLVGNVSETISNQGNPALTSSIVAIVCAVVVLMTCITVIVSRMMRSRDEAQTRREARPDEIGVTADEV